MQRRNSSIARKTENGKSTALLPDDDFVIAGARQYSELLESADQKAIEIILRIWEANRVQMAALTRAIDALNLPFSISGARLTVLRTIYCAPEQCLPLHQICKSTGLSAAMVGHLVDGLVKDELLERLPSDQDRRVNLARLTPRGAETFHTVLPVMSERMTEACAQLSEDDKDAILQLLQRLS